MAAKPNEQVPADPQQPARPTMNAEVGKFVMRSLGQPRSKHHVQVRQLWQDHYRVNVFIGLDTASAKVAHSYFVVADSEGNVVTSNPAIMKRY
jgi:hypothetical protein